MQSISDKVQEMRRNTETRKTRWLEKEKTLLAEMFNEGAGITEMALYFHRSEKAIFAQINEMGLYERILPPRQKKSGCLCPECEEREECMENGGIVCSKQVKT